MDYAEKILKKYGWKEGKGLGRDETGISKPLKCDLKFNKMGIGYQEKLSEETTNRWWQQVYDKAASNLSSTGTSKSGENDQSNIASGFAKLTDEELFRACGGRTAHKAARHGLRLNGKLERIEYQERKIADSTSSVEDQNIIKHKKRKQLQSTNNRVTEKKSECEEIGPESDSAFAVFSENDSVKKRKRKNKCESTVEKFKSKDSDAKHLVDSAEVSDHLVKKKKQKIIHDFPDQFCDDVVETNTDSSDKKHKNHKKSKKNKSK